jgi:hypothetical protein
MSSEPKTGSETAKQPPCYEYAKPEHPVPMMLDGPDSRPVYGKKDALPGETEGQYRERKEREAARAASGSAKRP